MENFKEIHIEKDFWDDFIVEAFEHIDAIESNAMELEQHPDNMDIIHTMFRAYHTIKGLAGFVEHSMIQEVAHKTETMMDLCRKGELQVNTEIVNAILKSSDFIKQMCNDMECYKDDDLIKRVIEHIENLERLSNVEMWHEGQAPVAPPQETQPQPEQNDVQMDFPAPPAEENQNPEPQEQEAQGPVFEAEAFNAEVNNEENQQPQEQQSFEEQPSDSQPQQEESSTCQEIAEHTPEGLEAFANEFEECVRPEEVNNEQPQQETNSEHVESVPEPEAVQEQPQIQEQPQQQAQNEIPTERTEEKPVEETTAEQKALSSFQMEIMKKLSGQLSSSGNDNSKEGNGGRAANEEYMKVANYKIDHLVDMIGELIINQSLIEQYVAVKYADDKELTTNMSGFLRITRELQNLSMSLRMVSLKSTFQKLTRIARDTIQELHKDVEVVISGENTEIDRVVAEKLLDPLVHMIKNAISHGIEENSQDRINQGKPAKGRVELSAYNKRGKIFIEVKDNGRGIDTEVVYKKALEKGMVDPNRTYSEAEIKEFIMMPGFSTAKVVDNISGRGVGMDVVKTQILKIGGKVEIQSVFKEGSTFTLEVPVNHAIMNGTIIEIKDQQFVVPTVNVKEFLQPQDNQWIFTQQERTMIKVRDNIIPIIPYSLFFKNEKSPDTIPLVMILELDQELKALPILNVINRQEVVVKPVSEEFSHLKYISGMSILGTGKVSLILDIDYMFKKEVTE